VSEGEPVPCSCGCVCSSICVGMSICISVLWRFGGKSLPHLFVLILRTGRTPYLVSIICIYLPSSLEIILLQRETARNPWLIRAIRASLPSERKYTYPHCILCW